LVPPDERRLSAMSGSAPRTYFTMARVPHIVFAGGAAPGNLYPGLAVAAHLAERIPEAQISFIGSGREHERHTVAAAGFRYSPLPSQPAPQRALHAIRFVTDNLAGYWAARWFFKEQHVSLVVGLGGAASASAVRAAISGGIPTVILEQNRAAGRVTKWLAESVTAVCVGFEETPADLPAAARVIVTGNPARPAFERLFRQRDHWLAGYCRLHDGHDLPIFAEPRVQSAGELEPQSNYCEKRLLIIGGAGGARTINENIPYALAQLSKELAGWQIVHQSGEGQLQDTERRYREVSVDALVVAYIDEMAPVMFDSELAVCRSGGTTLAELALAGLPAILVPYPVVMDFHLPNAEYFAAAGAATIIDETDLPGTLADALVKQLQPLLVDDVRRRDMAASSRRLARPEAASSVTDAICDALCLAPSRLAA
jgi:UDP-N-acetylglucosamine--N-acetylmuramyl-(pentapeptide) pyrophosphoryl-undecaprenol N-acetylglucosamine transferase